MVTPTHQSTEPRPITVPDLRLHVEYAGMLISTKRQDKISQQSLTVAMDRNLFIDNGTHVDFNVHCQFECSLCRLPNHDASVDA